MPNPKPETRHSKQVEDPPILYHPSYSTYTFGPNHPANPHKREKLLKLFDALGTPISYIEPELATDEEILTVHTSEYMHCVASASSLSWAPGYLRFGLDTDDVPIFPNMDEAARIQVGGTLLGARMIAEGKAPRVLQFGGGFHHAMPARASGFCIYNDLSIAARYFKSQGLRVAYIDIDVHHGDGVQWVHYREPDILTISLHESGRYLFPNTGFVHEQGEGEGLGASINIPLEQHTDDASYLEAFDRVVPVALERFKPDVLLIAAGVDTHFRDPLAHLILTTQGLESLFNKLIALSDQYTNGRALFAQSGGYDDLASIRAWTILIHTLRGTAYPEELPASFIEEILPEFGADALPLHDQPGDRPSILDKEVMMATNRETVDAILERFSGDEG
ncbi:MAG: acetoin utilization protein AcuC [Rhodothermaceae bacterium]|nr:acetoin utilization protein AcuC [Rhodothermaceae bacterium]